MTLELATTEGLAAGDPLYVRAPVSPQWRALIRSANQSQSLRLWQCRIETVAPQRVTLNQPLRIDYPVADGAFVRKTSVVRGCGIEDLSLQQTENLWITAVQFQYAWNCWARNVTVKKCGRHAIYGYQAKWCEIRDCVFDDAWFKGGGGTAYVGWETSWDCLMENVETFNFRHAPLFQWSASGNVIRKCDFHHSDGQWHSGWTHENLIEQCRIESVVGNGGYGYGLWSSPPEDDAHGPNGPRNCVYNCAIRSPKTGLWMGGMNENWLILHNYFDVGAGPGVLAKDASFDHILRDNVFVLRDSQAPMLHLASPDCTGVELLENRCYGGSGQICTGPVKPARLDGNRTAPLGNPGRPDVAVPSIYQWQRQRNTR
jgi:hypothetical protein